MERWEARDRYNVVIHTADTEKKLADTVLNSFVTVGGLTMYCVHDDGTQTRLDTGTVKTIKHGD